MGEGERRRKMKPSTFKSAPKIRLCQLHTSLCPLLSHMEENVHVQEEYDVGGNTSLTV